MKRISLRQLRTLAAVVDEGGFSRAAEVLHLTQPAVSLQIRELERECGIPLLDRSGKRLRLTDAGYELLRAGHSIERELRQAEDAITGLRGLKSGRLTIAVISTAQYFAPRLLTEFCRRFPDVQLRLDVCNRAAIIEHLRRDDVDAAIMGRPPAELALACEAEPFASHPHVALGPAGHPLAGRRRIPLKAFLSYPFIAREPGSGTRSLIQSLAERQGLPFAPTMVMNSNETIKQAVLAGMGVSFLSLHTVALERATDSLVALDVVGTPVVREWYLVHRKKKRQGPTAEAFREFMLAEAANFMARFMPDGYDRPKPGTKGGQAAGGASRSARSTRNTSTRSPRTR